MSASAALYPAVADAASSAAAGAGAAAAAVPAVVNGSSASLTGAASSLLSAADGPSCPPPFTAQQSLSSLLPAPLHRINSLSGSSGPSSSAPSLTPLLSRQLSTGRSSASSSGLVSPMADWRCGVTVEDRLQQRQKIRDAYSRQCPSYGQLLEMVQAVEEEIIFTLSASRMEYRQSAVAWEAKLKMKRMQMSASEQSSSGSAASTAAASAAAGLGSSNAADGAEGDTVLPQGGKRGREQKDGGDDGGDAEAERAQKGGDADVDKAAAVKKLKA